MSQNVKIHENSFKKFKEQKKKKENWLKQDTSTFKYVHFDYKPKPKKIAQEKLAEIDLDFRILEENYENIVESIVCICDNQGNTLWMNGYFKDLAFKGKSDVYMKPLFHPMSKSSKDTVDCTVDKNDFSKNEIIHTENGEHLIKINYEIIKDKKGNDFAFTVTGKLINKEEIMDENFTKKRKQIDNIEEKYKEEKLDLSIFKEHQDQNVQIIFVDLLGRVLWMNEKFSFCNFKSEKDLNEGIYHEFGFEVFSETYQNLLKSLPLTHSEFNIDYKRLDSKNQKPFGYLVTFHTHVQTSPNLNKIEYANSILSRVNLSCELLEEKYGSSEKIILVMSTSSRIIWINKAYSMYTKRTMEKDFMSPNLYEMLQHNLNNTFLVENLRNFLTSKGEKFQFSSHIRLKNGGRGTGKFDISRMDTEEGIPLLYFCETSPSEFQEE